MQEIKMNRYIDFRFTTYRVPDDIPAADIEAALKVISRMEECDYQDNVLIPVQRQAVSYKVEIKVVDEAISTPAPSLMPESDDTISIDTSKLIEIKLPLE